jgi:hypothetical protein
VEDFEIVQVPRFRGAFCWSDMWSAGVGTARHPIVVYMDSDRLLTKNYLEKVLEKTIDGVFTFTSWHFMATKDLNREDCETFLDSTNFQSFLSDEKFFGLLRFDPRFGAVKDVPAKNVMSGSTSFTKKTFLEVGPVDPWYCGHGAFADSDFHMQTAKKGCKFIDLQIPELHCHHHKMDKNKNIDPLVMKRLTLDNYIYYLDKWGLSLSAAEKMAKVHCEITEPVKYVKRKLAEIKRRI